MRKRLGARGAGRSTAAAPAAAATASALAAAAPAVAALAFLLTLSCSGDDTASRSGGESRELLERLRSVPYTTVTDQPAGGESGVTLHLRDKACPGYNFYCLRVEAAALLIDMDGNEVHRWSGETQSDKGWPYGAVLDNGDLITYTEDVEILRLDRDSRVIWRHAPGAHHEITPLPDGSFYTLVRRLRRHRGLSIRISDIVRMDSDGRALESWSAYEHLDDIKRALDTRSFLDTVLDSLEAAGEDISEMDSLPAGVHRAKAGGRPIYDYFHMNTVSILPETPLGREDPRFRAGNILTCFRNVNQIAVLDRAGMEIVWAWGEGDLEWPHHPAMLVDGSILIFDNGVVRKHSRVIEIDPVSGDVRWEYKADPPESFYAPTRGSAQRLPNGNTLICDSERGRCFEVTRDGEVVWEWFNPMLDEEGRRVQVYRMMRYPLESIEPILGR